MHGVQGLGASAHFVRASHPSLVRDVKMAPISHPTFLPGFAVVNTYFHPPN